MIYLDVDGVLNALDPFRLSKHTPGAETWPDFTEHDVSISTGSGLRQTFRLHLSKQMAAALWDASGGAITWHTTWNQDNHGYPTGSPSLALSNRKISPRLDWPQLEILPYSKARNDEWWKLTEIKQVELPKKFVWIDDDFGFELEARQWTEERGGLWIAPDSRVGITPDHIQRIIDYYG